MPEYDITYQVSYNGEPVKEYHAVINVPHADQIGLKLREHVEKKLTVIITRKELKKEKKKAA